MEGVVRSVLRGVVVGVVRGIGGAYRAVCGVCSLRLEGSVVQTVPVGAYHAEWWRTASAEATSGCGVVVVVVAVRLSGCSCKRRRR